ncbi:MAG: DNA polymerase III subunit beta [Holosporales bacterium]|jgi:DNA polymerase-3 subunit beta|nr:DNA polymerase III subunit beta [Holosporales bacterium]
MKIKVTKANLLRAMSNVCGVVERNPTLPILSHCLLSASEDKVNFSSTDLDHSVASSISAEVGSEGEAVIPAVTLYEIAKKVSDATPIEIDSKDNQVILSAGKAKFNLQSLASGDFPPIPQPHRISKLEVSAVQLTKLIDTTKFAMSTDETRYMLNGAYLHVAKNAMDKKCLRMVATDAHRLSMSEVSSDNVEEIENLNGIILSRKTIVELRRLLEDEPAESVAIILDKSLISFQVGQVTLTARIVEGNFPDYISVIPEKRDMFFSVKKQDFIDVIGRVSVIAGDKVKLVRIDLTNGCLKISANNENFGSANDEISAEYKGNSWYAGVNSRYLLDVASQIESENIRFYIQESVASILIVDPADNSSLFVVMPMRV